LITAHTRPKSAQQLLIALLLAFTVMAMPMPMVKTSKLGNSFFITQVFSEEINIRKIIEDKHHRSRRLSTWRYMP